MEGKLGKARQELFGFRALPKKSKGRHVLMERCRKLLEQVRPRGYDMNIIS